MSVYSEYLDHSSARDVQPETGRAPNDLKSNDFLMTGLLMRAVICLAFVGVGAVFSLV